MPRILVTANEIRDALASLPMIDVAGEQCVDGKALLAAIEDLVPFDASARLISYSAATQAQPRVALEPDVSSRADPTPATETPSEPAAPEGTIERARQLLAELPPGPCAWCSHGPHAHFACDEIGGCDCTTYADSTVRDPWLAANLAIEQGEPAPPWYGHGPPGNPGVDPMACITTGSADIAHNMFTKPPAHDGLMD